MPKLLRRNFQRISVVWMLVVLVSLVRFIVSRASHFEDFDYFGLMNFCLLLSEPILRMSLFFPKYVFVAPLSAEQREQLLLRGMKRIFRDIMMITLVFLIIPCVIYAICVKQYFGVLVCLTEMVFICSALEASIYGKYLSCMHVGQWIGTGVINWILYIFLSGGIGEQHGMKGVGFADTLKQAKGDVILLGIIMATSIGICCYFKVKYQKELICFMSDYECSQAILNDDK